MDEIRTVAAWLRQREGETDAAWIERLDAVFQQREEEPVGVAAHKLGERLWKRFEARIKAANGDS